MLLHLANVAVIADVVSDAVLLNISPVHWAASVSLGDLEDLKDEHEFGWPPPRLYTSATLGDSRPLASSCQVELARHSHE